MYTCYNFFFKLQRKIYHKKKVKPKSKVLDSITDYLIDHAILSRLLDHIASSGGTFLGWSACERVVEGIIADILIEQHSSLQFTEVYIDNLLRYFLY